MQYNDIIFYNQQNYSFLGNLLLYTPGLSAPIVLNDISIEFSSSIDHSNSTVIGVVTILSNTAGSVSIEVNPEQAAALVSASSVSINQYSEISIEY